MLIIEKLKCLSQICSNVLFFLMIPAHVQHDYFTIFIQTCKNTVVKISVLKYEILPQSENISFIYGRRKCELLYD